MSESLLQPRTVALLSSIFGLLALLPAMVGLYGITSYAVTRRKGEIAIRIALGAPRESVVRLMLNDVVVLPAIGMAAGLAASLAAGRLVTSQMFGVRPRDPVQLAVAVVVLAAATALAAYVPARRPGWTPMAALREEYKSRLTMLCARYSGERRGADLPSTNRSATSRLAICRLPTNDGKIPNSSCRMQPARRPVERR